MQELELLCSEAALAILNRMPFDPSATYFFEHLSGGMMWSDEYPPYGSLDWKVVAEKYLYRFLVAARHDITLAVDSPRFQSFWNQVAKSAPNWPGLRPERRSECMKKRLLAEKRLAARCYEMIFSEKRVARP